MFHIKSVLSLLICTLFLTFQTANAEMNIANSPISQQSIPAEELKIRLIPLASEDLSSAAEHWLAVLQSQLEQISEMKIRALNADGKNKEAILQQVNQLREEQTIITDKLTLILNELQKKSGDSASYKAYIGAVSGINSQVGAGDSSSILSGITGWLQSPEGGLRWAKNIALFVVTMIIFYVLAGFFGRFTERLVSKLKNTSDLLKHFFVNMVKTLTKAIGLMVALTMLEVNVGPLLAALGAMGFIIGFALQGTLSNFASGLMILIYRPYDLGNVINVSGTIGTVSAMTLVSTTLTTPDNQIVVIPNNAIWGSTITNITGSATRRVDMLFGIGYQDDIGTAESILEKILQAHPKILDTPEPVIKVHDLADSSVNFIVRPWATTENYFDVYWDITRSVKEGFDAAGISIPYPQQDVHMHTVAEAAIS